MKAIHAQAAQPMFQVIHLPRKTGYSKVKLNAELAPLKDKEAVKKLLRLKNFPSQTSIVLYINRANNLSAYWTINTSLPTNTEDNRIILQSRDNTTAKFYKLTEFRNFFKDTLAIIDTIGIELFIKDDDYPDDQYLLSSACGKSIQKKKILFENGKLLFTKELVGNCRQMLPVAQVYNNNNPEKILASCTVNFITADQQETLLSLADFIREGEPTKSSKDVALLLYSYSLHHLGRFYFPQLLNWLDKSNNPIRHGDHQ